MECYDQAIVKELSSAVSSYGTSLVVKGCGVLTAASLAEHTKDWDLTHLGLLTLGVLGISWSVGLFFEYYTLKRANITNNWLATFMQNRFHNSEVSAICGFVYNRFWDALDWSNIAAASINADVFRAVVCNQIIQNAFGCPANLLMNFLYIKSGI